MMRTAQSLLQDLRFAIRQLHRAPITSAAIMITLALAIGANAAIFSLVNAWLLRPLPLKNAKQLVSVWRTALPDPHQPAYFDLYHDYVVWAAQNHTMQSLAAAFEQDYTLTGTGEPREIHGAITTWNIFSTVGAQPGAGRLFVSTDADQEPSCVISDTFWRTQFGASRAVIGSTIRLNDKPYRVLGVLPRKFSLRILDRPFDFDVWTVIPSYDPKHTPVSPLPVSVIGRLKDGVTAAQAETDLNAIQRGLNQRFSDEPSDSGVLVAGLQQDNTRTIRSSLLLLWAAVAVLLLIACVNAGSLILGRNSQRATEFTVRLALGCSAGRLLQQVTAEILVLFLCGGAAGVAIALALLHIFAAVNPFGVLPPGGISMDSTVLSATSVVICLTAIVFGSVPAMRALRIVDGDALRARTVTASRSHLRSRMAFVSAEIALSVVLLVTAGLLISTFQHLASAPLGFRLHDVYVADLNLPLAHYPEPQSQDRFVEQLTARLRALPSVHAAGAATTWPFQANGLGPVEIAGRPGAERTTTAFTFTASPGYFETLGIPLQRGRGFTADDRSGKPLVAIINTEMARRYFPNEDPIGTQIRLGLLSANTPNDEPWLTIVGVVSSTRSQRYNHTDWDLEPAFYLPMYQRADVKHALQRSEAQTVYVYVQAQSLDTGAIAAAVHTLDPELPVQNLRSTSAIVDELQSQPRWRASVLGTFAFLTVLLAIVGIYGVMTQLVEQRRREIGIRIALGALSSNVIWLIMGRCLLLVVAGVGAGIAGAVAASRLVRGLLFQVSPVDPLTFTVVLLLLPAVAMLASYLPARRAASTDPNITLRYE